MKRIFALGLCLLFLVIGCLCLGSCGDNNKDKVCLTLRNLNLSHPTYTYDFVLNKGTTSAFIIPPTADGYTFLGYFDAPEGGTAVIDAQGHTRYIPTENMDAWAQWVPNVYELVLDPAEGTLPTGSEETLTCVYNSALTSFPVPVREGYDFLGWYCGETAVAGANGDTTADSRILTFPTYRAGDDGKIHLSARWEMHRVHVTFDYNDGTGRTETRVLDYGATLSLADLPSYVDDDRMTVGFSDSPTSSTLVTTDLEALTRDVTLFAVWDRFATVTLSPFEGESTEVRVTESTPYPLAPLERSGYAFEGWFADGSSTPVDRITYGSVAESYTARWSLITYTVTYDGGGAIFGTTSEDLVRSAEQPAPLPPHGFYNGAYIFDGWNTAADGSGAAFADGETVGFIPGAEDGHVTLYAQWRTKRYTITLDYANPSQSDAVAVEDTSVASVDVYYDTHYQLPTPTCTYFTLVGWQIGSLVFPSEELWTLDLGADGTTVTASAVWERSDKELTSTDAWENEEAPRRVNDGSNKQHLALIPSDMSRDMLAAYGYTAIRVDITIWMAEINDGYQHIYIWNGRDETDLIRDVVIEHGPGRLDTSWYEHTVTVALPIDKLNDVGGVYVSFGAHGNEGDDWQFKKVTYTYSAE